MKTRRRTWRPLIRQRLWFNWWPGRSLPGEWAWRRNRRRREASPAPGQDEPVEKG